MKKIFAFAVAAAVLGSMPANAGEVAGGPVYEDNGIVISFASEAADNGQTAVRMTYENTSGQNLSLMPRVVAVNGKVILWNYWGYGAVDVADGKKGIDEFVCDAENVSSFDAEYSAFNADYKLEFATGAFHAGETVTPEDQGTELYSDEMARLSYVGREGNVFEFCLTNTSDDYYGFDIENVSVNGFTIDGYDNFDLRYIGSLPNCQTDFKISLEGSENEELLSKYAIDNIEQISFNIDVLVEDSEFNSASYTTETIDCDIQ